MHFFDIYLHVENRTVWNWGFFFNYIEMGNNIVKNISRAIAIYSLIKELIYVFEQEFQSSLTARDSFFHGKKN